MNYFSVCSGIEAATVAWKDLGWKAIGFSEIDKFPCEVLNHHYPNIKNYGDMTKCEEWDIGQHQIDLLVGGTPCQSYSIAGKRKGMDDERGKLAIKFFDIVRKFKPRWIVWENVCGVLSSNKGRDFGIFLSEMAQCGYGFSYRVLDAANFGVPQRRRRVFVIGYLGDWRPTAAVLFESESSSRDTTQSGKKKEKTTRKSNFRFETSGPTVSSEQPYLVANTLTRRMYKGINTTLDEGQTPILVSDYKNTVKETILAPTITASNNPSRSPQSSEITQQIEKIFAASCKIRVLTPIECERLQGFPDDYTKIPWMKKTIDNCPDTPRYKALGNSMAVPCMKWLGIRIQQVAEIISSSVV